MDLHDRLNALRRQAGSGRSAPEERSAQGPAGDVPAPGVDELRARLDRICPGGRGTRAAGARSRSAVTPEELADRLGGFRIDEHLVAIDRTLPPSRSHGEWSLAHAMERAAPFWGRDTRIGFVDTETTGLAGGTGTVAFLVGLATLERGRIRLRHWLLTAFAGEAALLEALDDALGDCDHLVSYNGKSFDMPLLRDRRRMQRRPDAAEGDHTDFLHPVRSLFGSRWPDCRLRTVEERLLGLVRHGDLPGAEAPWAWQLYLTRGDSGALERVVRHNTDDILSLTLLGPVLARVLQGPVSFGASVEGAARIRHRLESREAAREVLEAGREHLTPEGQLWLAREWRRAGRYRAAVGLWEPLAEQGQVEALEELAKYHEHRQRDWQRALSYAQRLEPARGADKRCARLRARLAAAATGRG